MRKNSNVGTRRRLEPLSLLWCTFRDKRRNKWEVWVQSAPLYLDGEVCLGICFPHCNRILLDGGMGTRMLRQVLVHELIHAACFEEYDRNPEGIHIKDFTMDVEEHAALSVEETLTHVLPQLGWVMPPLPRQMPYLRRLRKEWTQVRI